MRIRNSVKKLPFPIKQGIKYVYGIIPPAIRHGKVFRDTYAFLQESQWWSREKLEEHQMQQLEKLLAHSYENVPYYRRIFDERGLKPTDIQDFDDLKKLPYLTKEIIREHLPDLVAKNYPKSKLHYVNTGGTTGIPLSFYWEEGLTDPKEWAFIWRQWNWAGAKLGDKRIILRGDTINRFRKGKRQWWEFSPLDNALILSSYQMTDETIPEYIEIINRFKPVAIQAFPSNLDILVKLMKKTNLRIESAKFISTSSETLYPHQRERIERFMGVSIYDLYGNTERNALIMQCEKHNYHIIPEYGLVELIGTSGNHANGHREMGEIIATGFNNFAMPLIRYKTGDFTLCSEAGCSCGRNYPLLDKVKGRMQEFVITRDNRLISMTGINVHSDVFDNVKQFQFCQDKKGELILNIVKMKTYVDRDTEHIKRLFEKLGDDMELLVRFVPSIPRTKGGKYRFLIQKLPIESENNK